MKYVGLNYQRGLNIKDIAKNIRIKLKEVYPECKFAVRIERYSMGQSLYITLASAPFDAILGGEKCVQVNQYYIDRHENLTTKAKEVMKYVYGLATSYNYDDSDSVVDYFDTNFYVHLNVGSWDKPFYVKEK